jgi:hypothetical protein
MPTDSILSLLISERDKLNRAITALQDPARGGPPRENCDEIRERRATSTYRRGQAETPQQRGQPPQDGAGAEAALGAFQGRPNGTM